MYQTCYKTIIINELKINSIIIHTVKTTNKINSHIGKHILKVIIGNIDKVIIYLII